MRIFLLTTYTKLGKRNERIACKLRTQVTTKIIVDMSATLLHSELTNHRFIKYQCHFFEQLLFVKVFDVQFLLVVTHSTSKSLFHYVTILFGSFISIDFFSFDVNASTSLKSFIKSQLELFLVHAFYYQENYALSIFVLHAFVVHDLLYSFIVFQFDQILFTCFFCLRAYQLPSVSVKLHQLHTRSPLLEVLVVKQLSLTLMSDFLYRIHAFVFNLNESTVQGNL